MSPITARGRRHWVNNFMPVVASVTADEGKEKGGWKGTEEKVLGGGKGEGGVWRRSSREIPITVQCINLLVRVFTGSGAEGGE